MTALTCPFCNTAFDLPSLPGRVVCPRCGEAIPAKLLPALAGPAITAAERQGPSETAPTRLGLRPVTLFGILLLVGSLVGLGLWYFSPTQQPDTAGPGTKAPPATRPPNALPGLLRLPPETQIALALQPAPCMIPNGWKAADGGWDETGTVDCRFGGPYAESDGGPRWRGYNVGPREYSVGAACIPVECSVVAGDKPEEWL